MNAKQELLNELTNGLTIKCAAILYGRDWDESDKKEINLKMGYTSQEYEAFLTALDFNYDDGYGTQMLFGHVWFTDGTWLERHEYDGAENWMHKVCPEIPFELY